MDHLKLMYDCNYGEMLKIMCINKVLNYVYDVQKIEMRLY